MSNSGPLFMAGGVSVSYLSMLMQRRKDIWGDNAEEFQPERWLEAASDGDPSSLKNLTHVSNPFSFTPFSAGPRICLGQSFALQECSYLLVRLLQRFDQLAFAPDAQPRESLPPQSWSFLEGRQSIERVRIRSSLTLYVDGGLWLRLKQADASS